MRKISQFARELDIIFQNYLVEQAGAHPISMSREEYMELSELVYSGGTLRGLFVKSRETCCKSLFVFVFVFVVYL